MIKSLFLTFSCIVNFSTVYASKQIMCESLLHRYQEICKNDDNLHKIKELKILLVEIETYYQGLLLTPDPARHLVWMLLCGFGAQKCLNHTFFYYLFCLALMYKGKQFLDDGSRYLYRDAIRERYAGLESLMAGIKMRLDFYETQVNV